MTFANLIKRTKAIEIDGLNVVIKKYPDEVRQWMVQRYREDLIIYAEDKDGEIKPQASGTGISLDAFIEVNAETMAQGIESWDLGLDDGSIAPVNAHATIILIRDFPDLAKKIMKEINEFNQELSPKNVKS